MTKMEEMLNKTNMIQCLIMTDKEYMKHRGIKESKFCELFNENYVVYNRKKNQGFDAGRVMLANGNEYRYIQTAVILGG
jgi:hypothetical protein